MKNQDRRGSGREYGRPPAGSATACPLMRPSVADDADVRRGSEVVEAEDDVAAAPEEAAPEEAPPVLTVPGCPCEAAVWTPGSFGNRASAPSRAAGRSLPGLSRSSLSNSCLIRRSVLSHAGACGGYREPHKRPHAQLLPRMPPCSQTISAIDEASGAPLRSRQARASFAANRRRY